MLDRLREAAEKPAMSEEEESSDKDYKVRTALVINS